MEGLKVSGEVAVFAVRIEFPEPWQAFRDGRDPRDESNSDNDFVREKDKAAPGEAFTPLPPPPGEAVADEHEVSLFVQRFLNRRPIREKLQRDLTRVVKDHLRDSVDVDPYVVTAGSLEIVLVATTVLTTMKNFNDYLDAITKTAAHIRNVFRAVIGTYIALGSFVAEGRYRVGKDLAKAAEAHENEEEKSATPVPPHAPPPAPAPAPAPTPAVTGHLNALGLIAVGVILLFIAVIAVLVTLLVTR